MIHIHILADMAKRAVNGMEISHRTFDRYKLPAVAATELVTDWELQEHLLFDHRDEELFEELGGTAEDLNEIRVRCIGMVKEEIERIRKGS